MEAGGDVNGDGDVGMPAKPLGTAGLPDGSTDEVVGVVPGELMANADAISLGDAAFPVTDGVTPSAAAIFLVPVVETEAPPIGGGKILGTFKGAALLATAPAARAGPAALLGGTGEGALGFWADVGEVLPAVVPVVAPEDVAA
jgi:hypothetical protein